MRQPRAFAKNGLRFPCLLAALLSTVNGGGTINIGRWLRGLNPTLAVLYAEGLQEHGNFATLQQIAAAPEADVLALFDQLEMKKPHRR